MTVQPTPQTGPRSEPVFAPHSGETAAPVDAHATTAMRPPHVLFAAIVSSVRTVLFSDEEKVRLAVGCFVAGGHLLVEDFPGLGKTTLAKALAYAFGLDFRRVQFTADLLPADITGAMVLDVESRASRCSGPGPVFTNVLMADELNRASPRAQSALLEAMEERQVTVDGHSFALPTPVHGGGHPESLRRGGHVAAAARPARPVSAATVARVPDTGSDEDALVAGDDPSVRVGELVPALSPGELQSLMRAVAKTHVAPAARAYLLDLVRATRTHPSVSVGASPRATMSVVRMARAMAVADGRSYVNPEDIRTVAGPALAHRLLLHAGAELAEAGTESIVAELLQRVPVPLVDEVTTLPTP